MSEQHLDLPTSIGLVGLGSGLMAALTGRRKLAFLAGTASAAAAVLSRRAHHETVHLEARVTSMNEQIRQLESAVASQVQNRMAAEEMVKSLSEQLASAEKRAGSITPTQIIVNDTSSHSEGLTDAATGLFNHDYFFVALDSRIAAARRHLRPVAVGLIQVVDGRDGPDRPPADPMVVAGALRTTLRESDTATRLSDGRFGVVLEDTPENGAIWTMERIRRCLAEDHPSLTVWAGVACYPAHAFDVDALISRAEIALDAAQDWHQDRIEVATAE